VVLWFVVFRFGSWFFGLVGLWFFGLVCGSSVWFVVLWFGLWFFGLVHGSSVWLVCGSSVWFVVLWFGLWFFGLVRGFSVWFVVLRIGLWFSGLVQFCSNSLLCFGKKRNFTNVTSIQLFSNLQSPQKFIIPLYLILQNLQRTFVTSSRITTNNLNSIYTGCNPGNKNYLFLLSRGKMQPLKRKTGSSIYFQWVNSTTSATTLRVQVKVVKIPLQRLFFSCCLFYAFQPSSQEKAGRLESRRQRRSM
jgi:hypothetical protein